jgi:multidrug efflux pump subunit AcrA (membrane-fusion protein)
MATKDDRDPAIPLAVVPKTASHKPSAQRGCGVYLVAIVVTAVLSLLSGVYLSGPLHGLLGLDHQHGHGEAVQSEGAGVTLWTCSMHPQVIQDHPGLCPICHMVLVPLAAAGDGKAGHMGALEIDPAVVQNMGVRTAKVRRGPVSREIRATGYLNEAQPKVHEINLRISGWIDKLYANYEGMYVGAGDPLFDLYSPEIHQAAGELINAGKTGNTHVASLGDAARRKLELWGLSKAQIDRIAMMQTAPRVVTFYSPVAGHVLDKHVVEGAGVMAGQQLFNIVDHSQLWMDIAIFERDLPFVAEGDPVLVMTEAHTGVPLEGTIVFIHPHVDMMTRAATARLLLNNTDMTYRPGMYATALLTKEMKPDALLVPREALIDTGVRQIVFLARDGGRFEPREVAVGAAAANGEVEILSGLEEDEEVVTSGQFLLDNESRIKEAAQKYLWARAAAGSEQADVAELADLSTDAVFEAYLALSESLGKQETEVPAFDAKPLLETVTALDAQQPEGAAKETIERLRNAVDAWIKTSPESARNTFKEVSAAAIALAKLAPPSKGSVGELYEVECPMAEASWLQRNDVVSNPYFADMKTCGEVKRTLALRESAP